MSNRNLLIGIFILLLAVALIGAGILVNQNRIINMTSTIDSDPPDESVDKNRVPENFDIKMAGSKFTPESVTIKVGDKITWINDDSTPHTVSSDDGVFESGGLERGKIFEYTFVAKGVYPYRCDIHGESMRGTIIVE